MSLIAKLYETAHKLRGIGKSKRGIGGVIYIAVGIMMVVVTTLIVSAVITNAAFTGINNTVATYVPTFMLLGALVLGASIAINYLKGAGE